MALRLLLDRIENDSAFISVHFFAALKRRVAKITVSIRKTYVVCYALYLNKNNNNKKNFHKALFIYHLKNLVMNKKTFFAAMTLALMAVSCTQNEVEDVNIVSSDAIALNPSTAVTRASIWTLDTLKNDGSGFVVYATNGSTPTGWNTDINGKNNHQWKPSESKWGFANSVNWPSTPADYPMTFYAYYPSVAKNVISDVSNFPNVLLKVTIPRDKTEQRDLLAGKGATNNKPASGSLAMGFNHILSKVNFTVTNSVAGQEAFIQALGFVNLKDTCTYNVVTPAWGSQDIKATRDTFDYFNAFTPSATAYTSKTFKNVTNASFFAASDNANLMLLPQAHTSWNTDPAVATVVPPVKSDSYVRMLYRVEDPTNPDYIGFKNATSHSAYTANTMPIPGYTGPLFVLVGYSYSSTTDWNAGKGYIYNIPVPGTTGGRLLDEYLYDDHGNKTILKVPGGSVPGVIISSDDEIRLDPTVNAWDDQTPDSIIEK